MSYWPHFALAALLVAGVDIPHGSSLRSGTQPVQPSGANLPVIPGIYLRVFPRSFTGQAPSQIQERLDIVRFVDGEFARVVRPLPADKKGFRYNPRMTWDEKELQRELARHGSAIPPGATVQITDLIFREKEIVVEINGGAKPHGSWRNHIQIGIGGMPGPPVTTAAPSSGQRPPGATLILDYGKALPDMSPDDVKHDLSVFLNFANERSAATNWVETLPPAFRNAIRDRRAVVGMNRDMVLAALGEPSKKVRETNEKGEETEDWIYGTPPGKTIFVTFMDEKVSDVKEFP